MNGIVSMFTNDTGFNDSIVHSFVCNKIFWKKNYVTCFLLTHSPCNQSKHNNDFSTTTNFIDIQKHEFYSQIYVYLQLIATMVLFSLRDRFQATSHLNNEQSLGYRK